MNTHAAYGAHHIFTRRARVHWRAALGASLIAVVLADVCAAIYADAVLSASRIRVARLEAEVGVNPYSPAAQR
jgi:hypothetical protein